MLSRDKYCTLIALSPKWAVAQYFDLSNVTTKKNYEITKGVLDDALEGYFQKGGTFDNNRAFIKTNRKHGFRHVTEFPCIKQPAGSVKESFYAPYHLKVFVRDSEMLRNP